MLLARLLVGVLAVACDNATSVTGLSKTVALVALNPRVASIMVGQTTQLTAIPEDASGAALFGRVVSWAPSDSAVALVDGYGLVKGVAPGAVTIIAMCEGKTDSAAIVVLPVPVASVEVTPAAPTITVGMTVQVTATPKDSTGSALANRQVAWTSSDPTVAIVSVAGVVTGVGAGGPVTVTATSEGKTATAAVTVAPVSVAIVAVTPASASITAGFTEQLSAVPRDANGDPLTGRAVTWSSSDAAVATVSNTGLVTGVAAGPAIITATSEGKSGTATVTVLPVLVATVLVAPPSATIEVGQTHQFSATPQDAYGAPLSGRSVSWSSNDSSVARVSGTGLVTGVVAGGPVAITATSEGQRGTTTVTVIPVPVAHVIVAPMTASVLIGLTQQLTAAPLDLQSNPLSGRAVTWSSSNAGIATVSPTGLVTGVAAGGPVTITALSEGQSGSMSITVTAPPVVWPNEPAALTTMTDWGFDQDIPRSVGDLPIPGSGGWHAIFNTGLVSRVIENTPFGPSAVSRWEYPIGFEGGAAPGTLYYDLPFKTTEIYLGFWWKVSDPWQGHASNVNKICFLTTGTTHALIPELFGQEAPYDMRIAISELGPEQNPAYLGWLDNNVNNVPPALGVWHRIEIYAKYGTSSTSNNGIVKLWMDGMLLMHYTDINFAAKGFDGFSFSPTWGGVTDQKTETDYYWFDRVRMSGVVAPLESLTVSLASASVEVGGVLPLTATPYDANGNEMPGQMITWTSSDNSIAVVTSTGLVTAVGPGGPVTITASAGGHRVTTSITVSPVGTEPVAHVVVVVPAEVTVGNTVQLTPYLFGSAGQVLAGRTVTWSSSNTTLATVSQTGLLTGVAAGGPVTITATSEGQSGTGDVTVRVRETP